MKKFWKILRNILIGLLVAVLLFLGGTYLNHHLKLKSEAKKIENYGEKVKVFDGEINVVRTGSGKGKQSIILFPGYGTASPYYDFLPLTTKLSKDYEVITIEPFGYGLSSETKRTRNVDNIVEEMHEVVKQLNLDHYVLGGHSITGLYGVNYLNRYPEEKVDAFLGIDTSTPTQEVQTMNMAPFNFLKKSGMMRLLIDANPAKGLGMKADDPNLEQVRMLTLKNSINDNLEEELDLLRENFKATEKMSLPKDLPTILFVAINDGRPTWAEEHQEQIKQVRTGKVVELDGQHYLHHTQSEAIAKETKLFLDSLK
ncbi:alpha/beta fold hydrolase [Vagococcus hydrophili]|uniref:Alpha/beta hydrolase n=1 Tax=Vagococcus hydrophili TaxID=2714947 RepID=A0A6G8AS52_9ENTE|nr:alpha/beta hydrolase [Vagococcus hydrophili]QIL47894.1 alpha/beta hydrolase [Vagococcus hydrophili]